MSDDRTLRYSSTLLYGKYTSDLSDYARSLKSSERDQQSGNNNQPNLHQHKCPSLMKCWSQIQSVLGDQWMLMIILGMTIAVLSFVMDHVVLFLHNCPFVMPSSLTGRMKLFNSTPRSLSYLGWISLPVLLVTFASAVVQLISPHAIGSGFAEIRCLLRGTTLHGYLDFRTLAAKVVGLVAVLGAGMPLGKEGPFVHIACILSQLYTTSCCLKKSSVECRSRSLDLLAGAAAVGVGACFASPVGGVLLSIEATAANFAIRNYWRGFLGAAGGTLLYQLLVVWSSGRNSIEAIYATQFSDDVPYRPLELLLFGFLGMLCGLLGALFVYILRVFIQKMKMSRIREYLLRAPLLYPLFLSLIITTLQYPVFMSRLTAGHLDNDEHFAHLFSNFSWAKGNLTEQQTSIVHHWESPIKSMIVFFVFLYISSILASTLPVPSGMFIPLFKIGAAFGRILGETFNMWVHRKFQIAPNPGGYAVVGAAAFSGAVTHTVSTCVIVVEITGQLRYVLPIIVAAMISNIVARRLHPSLYDMLTSVKGLEHPPDVAPLSETNSVDRMTVKDFMESPIEFVWRGIGFRELSNILESNPNREVLPVVDDPENRSLLGTVKRVELEKLMANCSMLLDDHADFQWFPIESIRIQLLENDSLAAVQKLFQLTKVNFAFVTNQSLLVGFVGKNELEKAIKVIQENPIRQTVSEHCSGNKFDVPLGEQNQIPNIDLVQTDDQLGGENLHHFFDHVVKDHKNEFEADRSSKVLFEVIDV